MENLAESLVKQVLSKENMIILENEIECSKCKTNKRVFYGNVCFICSWTERGDRFQWVECSDCGIKWSKLRDCGVCVECDKKRENERTEKEKINKTLINYFGSDRKMLELSFENFDEIPGTSEALIACKNFDPEKDNLYLWGKTGRGKTHLVYATTQEFIKLGKKVEIMTIRDFVNRFRLIKPEDEKNLTNELVRADLLVLDDLGRFTNSEFANDILINILDKRSLFQKNGLLITSNLFLDSLAQQNGDRLSSRLSGMCRTIEIRSMDDMRMRKKEIIGGAC